jgi:hypothetical protein
LLQGKGAVAVAQGDYQLAIVVAEVKWRCDELSRSEAQALIVWCIGSFLVTLLYLDVMRARSYRRTVPDILGFHALQRPGNSGDKEVPLVIRFSLQSNTMKKVAITRRPALLLLRGL